MATPKNWLRNRTRADDGLMHKGSMDAFRPEYYESALNADTLEDEAHWATAVFHGPEYCEANNKESFRPNIRSQVSIGTTNFMTQAQDISEFQNSESFSAFTDILIRIIAVDECDREVIATLAYTMVNAGLNQYLCDFDLASVVDDQLAADIQYFESISAGSENADNWTGRAKLRNPKSCVWGYLECTKHRFYKAERTLASICVDLFGDSPF
ncbi:hypothetical protein NVP1031O_131 [Vibrio phage 1.031.O._10N.261.46.F8]|nr:hypothetical protein NVP1031O_131 [Vibrio phage 1.031.O._10N.261.46.F8]